MQVLQKSLLAAEAPDLARLPKIERAHQVRMKFYDLWSLGVTARYAWNCPTFERIQFYDDNISNNHLDVGPASGFLVDRCRFPTPKPRLGLLDLNPDCLASSAVRLIRYHPILLHADVLRPMKWDSFGFDSIGVNYVLHCLPGSMREKGAIFQHLKVFMNDGCTVFGTTILGKGMVPGAFGRRVLKYYNAKHLFYNYEDTFDELDSVLDANFDSHKIWTVGMVAFFIGR